MKTIVALLLALISTALATNLVQNGSFVGGTTGWRGQTVVAGKIEERPEFVAVDSAERALRLQLTGGGSSHNTGVTCALTESVPPGTYRVRFRAKWVSGAKFLHVRRTWGGSNAVNVELAESWRDCDATLTTQHDSADFLFTLVSTPTDDIAPTADGVCLIKDVVIERQ